MKTILVPVDFSDATARVIETAKKVAGPFKSRIVLLHVAEPEPDFIGFEPGPVTVRTAVAHDMREEHQHLEALKEEFASAGIDVTALQIQGSTIEKIMAEAVTQKADLIVLGSHGHGALYHLLVGSVTEGVLKSAQCPILIVPVAKR